MNQNQSLPVIIGTGLSGLAISRTLSDAGCRHFLIGSPPDSLPRLGESINLEGTVDLLRLFPELSQFYFPKKAWVVYLCDKVVACDFEIAIRPKIAWLFRLFGLNAPPETVHVDRIGFDEALYNSAVADSSCTHIDARVENIKYDTGLDTIKELNLSNQVTLTPSFVFDATNHVRLVAKTLGVKMEYLSEPKRVVYTHYKLSRDASYRKPTIENWQHWTNLLRLYPDSDGIDGFAWCIPLGDTMSIGISMNTISDEMSDEHVLAILDEAYARRNIDYRKNYIESTKIRSLQHRYFIHERAYGKNWLLAGPSFCQIWYMSGSGVGTSLAAARIAPHVVKSPMLFGRAYEAYMKELLINHWALEWLVSTDKSVMTQTTTQANADTIIKSNLQRLGKYVQIRETRMTSLFGKIFYGLLDLSPFIKDYCEIVSTVPEEQTHAILK